MNSHALIYGLVDYGEGARVVILNRSEAEDIFSALKAIRNSATWHDFRQACPQKYVDRIHENLISEGDHLPDDSRLFCSDQIPYLDYDWPQFASGLFGEGLPRTIVSEYGEPYDTVLDGLFIHFNPEDLITIRKELTRLGYSLERDDEKAAHAVGYGKLNF
ncbi:MAG TPA: hypothetical protein DEF45_25480 [Rhodopirellula sp.]|nr:MAG: hypothetical protein CBD74_06705 [Saprospirales bacterium TMED214]HBV66368.1 hypothetical protein [Rhodopirellula sp.]